MVPHEQVVMEVAVVEGEDVVAVDVEEVEGLVVDQEDFQYFCIFLIFDAEQKSVRKTSEQWSISKPPIHGCPKIILKLPKLSNFKSS